MRINKRNITPVTESKPVDKRTGKKTVVERTPARDVNFPSYTLPEAVDFVMKVKRANNLKERTIRDYETNMAYFIEWVEERYGTISISDVTAAMLRDYVLWCANDKVHYDGHPYKADSAKDKSGLSAASVNVRIRVLRTFFNVLHTEELIDRNPAVNLSLMRQDIDTVEPLSENELQRLMRAPDQRNYAQWRDYIIMVLIIDTGMRLGEVCSLEKKDIDFQKKQILLPAVKNKNRRSRVLPLSTETIRLLRQLIAESEQHFESDYVFTTNYGEQLSDKTVQKSFKEYGEKARIEKPVSPHRLRHNFATMAATNGMDVFSLMKMMGHADISTTRKYVQVSGEDLTEQHKRFSPLGRVLKRGK